MKKFFRTFFAALLAFVIGSVICMFIFFGILSAMLSFADTSEPVTVKPNTILHVMLDQPVQERGGNNLSNVDIFNLSIESSTGLNDLVKGIKKAADDPNIKLVYMDLSHIAIGLAQLEELREALLQFKESEKPIIAYGDNYSQGAYYLATVADKIYLNPYGSLALQGMRVEVTFFKRLLEKLQIDVQIIRHGKFKSAVEPFMLDEMSKENEAQLLSFSNSIWHHWLDKIAETRQKDVKKLQQLIDDYTFSMISPATGALENGLVDGLMYKDELLDELVRLTGVNTEKDLALLNITKYAKTVVPNLTAKDRIAVVYADGEISVGKGEDGVTDWQFANLLRDLRRNDKVKAVVFRVNSPGGSAQASEIIARELALLNEIKPVVVSMSNYAASGGYWISTPSRAIVANPTTLTGSIGVFGIVPNLEKGLRNHLGLTVDVAKTAKGADFPSVTRPLTTPEREKFQGMVDNTYTQFVAKVAQDREIAEKDVDEIGQGRVWSGLQALENGLVDYLGGLDYAIHVAAELAELTDYRITELPVQKDPFTQLLEMFKNTSITAKGTLSQTYKQLEKQVEQLLQTNVQARMPFDVEIY
ncbi:MAG: signal peptide peptidase SppA [Prevotellaceae bacterium]|jgi:protease-4|nr:signal peptide peptidase SppA [Prevotellaceae bacterium]